MTPNETREPRAYARPNFRDELVPASPEDGRFLRRVVITLAVVEALAIAYVLVSQLS